jgi:lipopolysaccharide transport system ATP-binding protein
VDEVLAVGDAEFQKKCLGKMKDVAGHGRTILFVSHNMPAVRELCGRAIYLKNGLLESHGDTKKIVEQYFSNSENHGSNAIPKPHELLYNDIFIESVVFEDSNGYCSLCFVSGSDWRCKIRCKSRKPQKNIILAVGLVALDKTPIQTVWSEPINTDCESFEVVFTQKPIELEEGTYSVLVGLSRGNVALQQFEAARIEFESHPSTYKTAVKKYGTGFIVNAMEVEILEH